MAKKKVSFEQRLARGSALRAKAIARFNRRRKPGTLIARSRAISPLEKAAFHQVVGAGRSHVKRPFFGLTTADEDAIVALVRHELEQALKGA